MHDRDGSGTISFDEFQSLHQFIVNTQVRRKFEGDP
jgi:hypothetical protein